MTALNYPSLRAAPWRRNNPEPNSARLAPGLVRQAARNDEQAARSERIQGIPGTLPPGETIVWQGKPMFRSLARHLCHVNAIALYFSVVLLGTATMALLHGSTPAQMALTMAPLLGAATLALGLLLGMAWSIARTTEYTLTTRRLVIRSGMALPAILVIPYNAIAHAAVAMHPDQTGDLPLTMKPGQRVALHRIWPHSRPWHLREPQPMLRSVPRAGHVATVLAARWQRRSGRRLQSQLEANSTVHGAHVVCVQAAACLSQTELADRADLVGHSLALFPVEGHVGLGWIEPANAAATSYP